MSAPLDGSGASRAAPERDLSLPLVDDQDSELWTTASPRARDRSVWPALTDALSETGCRLLWDALREALDATPGDPERALMVVEAFWRTMQLRQGPDYERRLADPGPSRLYGPGELRCDVG
jgi:hypothetical protein